MPYQLASPQRPRSGPHDDAQKHPEEAAGKTFTAVETWQESDGDLWLRSSERSIAVGYPEKWYKHSWCVSISANPVPPPPSGDLEAALLVVLRYLKSLWGRA